MSRIAIPLTIVLCCAGCAKPSTLVLEPYALADGKMFQDVVTIASDERGTAPVVTHLKTFELRTGYKGAGAAPTRPIAQASGSGPGFVPTLTSSAISAAIPAAAGVAIAASGWSRARISNTVSSNISSNSSSNSANDNNISNDTTNMTSHNISNNNNNNNNNNNTNF